MGQIVRAYGIINQRWISLCSGSMGIYGGLNESFKKSKEDIIYMFISTNDHHNNNICLQ